MRDGRERNREIMFRIKQINFSYYIFAFWKFLKFLGVFISTSVEHFYKKFWILIPHVKVSEMFWGLWNSSNFIRNFQLIFFLFFSFPSTLSKQKQKLSHQQKRSFHFVTSDFHQFDCRAAEFIIFKCREQHIYSALQTFQIQRYETKTSLEQMTRLIRRCSWIS